MSICGYPFIYNTIPSELYKCSIVFLNENYTDRPSGSGVEFITDTIQKNARVVHLGTQQTPPLEFGIEIVFDDPVDIFVLTQVKDWLGGEIKFRQLQICADYFNTFYFNCYIQLEDDLIYAGGYRGIRATVICDSPWAWEFEDSTEYALTPNAVNNIYFNNLSADSELLRPKMEFTMATNGSFILQNATNNNRITQFSNLTGGETIVLDNLYGFLSSSMSLNRVANFNKTFLKMPKDINHLIITGQANRLKLTYENAKRIGGGFY